jgi:putative membrane protein insertion efficiency factor
MKKLPYFSRFVALRAIKIYQKTLSFDHGPLRSLFPGGYCRFQPTCSQYGYQAIEKYGVLRGGTKIAWRILRCNPFSQGGHDPIK